MHALNDDVRTLAKPALYEELESNLRGLLAGEPNLIACAANMSSLLYWSLPDLNWAGFYLLDETSGDLLSAVQGKPACVRIPLYKGVCGAAAAQRRTLVVQDVHAFPGHIACDSASNSEVVVPIVLADGRLLGVLDLDSPVLNRFDEVDAQGLERLVDSGRGLGRLVARRPADEIVSSLRTAVAAIRSVRGSAGGSEGRSQAAIRWAAAIRRSN
jgi:GAF domain-containing protein